MLVVSNKMTGTSTDAGDSFDGRGRVTVAIFS